MKRFALAILVGMLAATCTQAQVKYTDAIEWMPEFSGCFWRSTDGEAFWACADERHIDGPPEQSRDEIWKFDFDTGAVLATNTFTGGLKLNDMEAMSVDGEGGYFIATSQSLTSALEGGANRMRLSHFDSNGALDDTAENFRYSLTNQFNFLGAYWMIAPKEGGVYVEGIAFDPDGNRMWVGLRGPLVDTNAPSNPGGHAILVTMTNVLDGGDFDATGFDWIATPKYLDLGSEGIRDLYWDADTTNLFLLTGKHEGTESYVDGQGVTNTTTQSCHVLAYNPATKNLTFCLRLPQVPSAPGATTTSEAEGICAITLDSQKKLLVVYDSKTHGVYQAVDFPSPDAYADESEAEGSFGM